MNTQLETHGPTLIDRFWSKVEKTEGCWWWTAAVDKDGYGQFSIGTHSSKKTCRAHRLSYTLATGLEPGNKHVLHECDNPRCVNPAHLSLGSHVDNVTDMHQKGRQARGSKHGLSKLSEGDVRHIKADNRSLRAIAKSYGVAASTIAGVRTGKTWKHAA